ncbi:TBC1 domain family member 13-like protein [Trifolium pratense]|uniref:TBC1 domain family member 13-like protein n=1 Tax=Trifolium pratense TaxID=57577 RepID=A0A2K3MLC5_TRIPR|nr:TBC1 domain family member 13-like protein [Trifolium pratense]
MMKKKVPDWLNSSLWSSPTSSPPSPAITEYTSPVFTPIPPPQPPSPPPLILQDPPPTQIIQESQSEDPHDAPPSEFDISHQTQLLAELSKKVMDMRELRRIACQGVPDSAGIRSTLWKLLLGYLPPDRGLWSSELAKKRSQYKQFKEEILMNPVS